MAFQVTAVQLEGKIRTANWATHMGFEVMGMHELIALVALPAALIFVYGAQTNATLMFSAFSVLFNKSMMSPSHGLVLHPFMLVHVVCKPRAASPV